MTRLHIGRFTAVLVAWGSLLGAGCVGPARLARTELRSTHDAQSLHARFFGVSTIFLADETSSILLDGFFTRPCVTGLVTGFKSNSARVTEGLRDLKLGRPEDVLLVAHSHHDHALDSAIVAARTGLVLHGSALTGVIATRQRPDYFPKNAELPGPRTFEGLCDHAAFTRGRFTITPIETPHATAPWYIRMVEGLVWLPGVRDFPFDTNFCFHVAHPEAKILIVPSAAPARSGLRKLKADVVFLSIAYLARQEPKDVDRYWCEYVIETGARLVIPIHWDNLMGAPGQPLREIPRPVDNIEKALRLITERAASCDVQIGFMPLNLPVLLPVDPAGAPK